MKQCKNKNTVPLTWPRSGLVYSCKVSLHKLALTALEMSRFYDIIPLMGEKVADSKVVRAIYSTMLYRSRPSRIEVSTYHLRESSGRQECGQAAP